MKKMYYTDPLKSAWMVREFGVQYGQKNMAGDIVYIYRKIGNQEYKASQHILESNMYYIHPDSLHIFEPKVGDIVFTGDNDYMEITYDVAMFRERHGISKIIQRDNRAFFTPEVEK